MSALVQRVWLGLLFVTCVYSFSATQLQGCINSRFPFSTFEKEGVIVSRTTDRRTHHHCFPTTTTTTTERWTTTFVHARRESSKLSLAATAGGGGGGNVGSFVRSLSLTSFSPSALAETAATAPAHAYFLALLSAGVGVPVSEDAICVIVGYVLPRSSPLRRRRLLLAIYAGVVGSDLVTFTAGRLLRLGLLGPLRRLLLGSDLDDGGDDESSSSLSPSVWRRVEAKMEEAGDYAGLVVRLSVGMRGPLMLAMGFANKVSYLKFGLGVCAGAFASLSIQLAVGLGMNPQGSAGTAGAVWTIVKRATVLGTAALGAILVGVSIWTRKVYREFFPLSPWSRYVRRRKMDETDS